MKMIDTDTKMAELLDMPELREYRRYLLFMPHGDQANDPLQDSRISDLAGIGWSPEGITAGVNCFLKALNDRRVRMHFVYSDEECSSDPDKKDVNIIQISPEKPAPDKPVIVLCSGGGYQAVCNLAEAFPTARHMLETGCTVFIVTYRVAVPQAALAALDDLAAAVSWLCGHANETGVDATRYAIGGYSAGANLISNWGCTGIGWKHYGVPKPVCMFPVYTFIDLKAESHRNEQGGILPFMFGDEWRSVLDIYNVEEHIDSDYPPCYIVCGKDDATVPCRHSEIMKERLDAAGVPAILDEGEHAAHGFGDGTGTDAEGWPKRALAFLESI